MRDHIHPRPATAGGQKVDGRSRAAQRRGNGQRKETCGPNSQSKLLSSIRRDTRESTVSFPGDWLGASAAAALTAAAAAAADMSLLVLSGP